MAEFNHRKKEELAQEVKAKENKTKLSYGVRAVMAVGALGLLGYYIYQRDSPGDNNATKVTPVRSMEVQTQVNKFEMSNLLYYKMSKIDKKSMVNNLYQVAVISIFAICYSMLGKKILKMTPASIQKFDLEDTGKLVANVAVSDMLREYLIKQKLLPEQLNVYVQPPKMASIAMLIRGALFNALPFTGSHTSFPGYQG